MNQRIYGILSEQRIQNDLSFPFWIYKIEIVDVAKRKFIKVYLFNRKANDNKLNSITFSYDNHEYTVSAFSVVSAFQDKHIVGCFFEIDAENIESSVVILKEKVNNEIINSSRNLIQYKLKQFPSDDDYLQRKFPLYHQNHIVYPQINDDFWQCSCGRIHKSCEQKCTCGQNLEGISEIVNFDIEAAYLQEYIDRGINYNLNESFEENIERYKMKFTQEYGYDADKLDYLIDYEDERKYFDGVVSERIKAKKKFKKKFLIIFGSASVAAMVIACLVLFAPKYINYAQCVFLEDLEDKVQCYGKAQVLDAEAKADDAFKKLIYELDEEKNYTEIVDAFDKNKRYVTFMKYKDKQWTITDNEFEEIFLNAYQIVIENSKDNTLRLKSLMRISNDFGNIYYDQIDKYIYENYVNSIQNGGKTTITFFQERYEVSQDIQDYVYMLEALHNTISNQCQTEENTADMDYSLVKAYGFETTLEFYHELQNYNFSSAILNDQCYDTIRLQGYWSNNGYYFQMNESGQINYNVPWFEYGDYYGLYNHIIYLFPDGQEDNSRNLFEINFINDNTITIYSYQNGLTYTLYKN